MTTVQITLPDDVALQAQAAGLLVPETLTAMLRERLRRQNAGERLQELLAQMPRDDLTPRSSRKSSPKSVPIGPSNANR